MDSQNNNNPEKTKKLEIELNLELYELIDKFCNFINWPIDRFVQKALKDTIMFYKNALDKDTEVSETLYKDFLEKSTLKKLAAIYKFKI